MLVLRLRAQAPAVRTRRCRRHVMDSGLLLPARPCSVAFVREERHPPQQHMTLKQALITLAQNRSARRVLLPDFLLGIAQGVSGGLFLFFFQFILGFERESQTLLAIYFIAGLAGVPIWWFAARRWGKHRALQGALIYTRDDGAPHRARPTRSGCAPFMVVARARARRRGCSRAR